MHERQIGYQLTDGILQGRCPDNTRMVNAACMKGMIVTIERHYNSAMLCRVIELVWIKESATAHFLGSYNINPLRS